MLGLRALLLFVCTLALFADDAHDRFETKVRPLLAKSCYPCHTKTELGGLRLDSRDAILKGGKSGAAAIVGDSEHSVLFRAVTYEHTVKMPPTGKLGKEEIDTLREWIDDGLYWPVEKSVSIAPQQWKRSDWWAFQLPQKQATPVLSTLPAPQKPISKRAWLRRSTLALTGLPPTADEIEAYLADKSTDADAKVVDRLLASPRYGEIWGRHWLDVARYSDDKLNSTQDEPYGNAFRFRNWVIHALNADMPYDKFVMAQIAGDQMKADSPETYAAGLGFFAMSPEFQDDRVDALTRGFLGVTVACAQCHDHKFDPIPTKDFYALQGVFASSEVYETPLVRKEEVDAWQALKKEVDRAQKRLDEFRDKQRDLIAEMLAARSTAYILAASGLGPSDGLDNDTVERWKKLFATPKKDYPHLNAWFTSPSADEAHKLERVILDLLDAKRKVDKENEIRLGSDPSRRDLAGTALVSLPRDDFAFWRDLFGKPEKDSAGFFNSPDGVYYYGGQKSERWLSGDSKAHCELLKQQLADAKKALPKQYPFLHTLRDKAKPADIPILIRGDRNNRGNIAPRAFLTVLSKDGNPTRFTNGSGRLELAEAIASKDNPLTARVIVNRVWAWHFGKGISATPSNFGLLGETPTDQKLLDDMAVRFMEQGWSLKTLHREIVLSQAYRQPLPRRRLDFEVIRDSILAAAGTLDEQPGEAAAKLDTKNTKRTVYGYVSRRKLDGALALFDFPNPNNTAEQRINTNVPPQRLYFFNSPFVEEQAKALASSLNGATDEEKIRVAYRRVYGRAPEQEEIELGTAFLQQGDWTQYARVLLTSNEFLYTE